MWHWWQHDQHGLNFVSPQHQTCHQHPTAHPSAWLPLRRAPPPRLAGAGGAAAPSHARGPPQMAGSGWSGGQPAAAERLPGAAGRPQPCCRPELEPFLLRVEMGPPGAATTSAVFPQCFNQVQGAPDVPPPSTLIAVLRVTRKTWGRAPQQLPTAPACPASRSCSQAFTRGLWQRARNTARALGALRRDRRPHGRHI